MGTQSLNPLNLIPLQGIREEDLRAMTDQLEQALGLFERIALDPEGAEALANDGVVLLRSWRQAAAGALRSNIRCSVCDRLDVVGGPKLVRGGHGEWICVECAGGAR